MPGKLSEKARKLGYVLPTPSAPAANYINHVISNNTLYISGQIPLQNNAPAFIGRLGEAISEEEGALAAQLAALSLLAQLGAAIDDDLSRLVKIIRLGVFVASTPDFKRQGVVANGASNLLVEVLGESGRHARTAIGVASLPTGVAVELDAIFELRS